MLSGLAYVAVRLQYVQRYAHRHKCKGSQCTQAPEIAIPGDGDWLWTTCPIALLSTPWWQVVSELHFSAEIAPLHGWPHGYSMWVSSALRSIRHRQAEERERQLAESEE